MSKIVVFPVTIHFGDCDPAGIVFYPNFLRWMDAASAHFFAECGVPPWRERPVQFGQGWLGGDERLEIGQGREEEDVATIWQHRLGVGNRLLRLANVSLESSDVRVPRDVRDLLARFGIAARPGIVRLPPLPPLWH